MAKQTFTTGQVLSAAQMTSLQQTAMGGGSATAKTASYVLVASDAGTVVQMNSASATTITVNAALFAAGDSVQIMNIGTGVCTITAGTATVSTAGSLALSQWEGGQLYFNSASASIFFDIVQGAGMTNPMTTTGDIIYSSPASTPVRRGIGSSGQVLTVSGGVPTWAAPPAAGWNAVYSSYSPDITQGGANIRGFTSIKYSTTGDWAHMAGQCLINAAGTANTAIQVTLPVTVNTPNIGYYPIGLVYQYDTSAGNYNIGTAVLNSATTFVIYSGVDKTVPWGRTGSENDGALSTNDEFNFDLMIRIN